MKVFERRQKKDMESYLLEKRQNNCQWTIWCRVCLELSMQRRIVFRRPFYGEEKGPSQRWEDCAQEVHLIASHCSTCTKKDEERIRVIIQTIRWPNHTEEEVD